MEDLYPSGMVIESYSLDDCVCGSEPLLMDEDFMCSSMDEEAIPWKYGTNVGGAIFVFLFPQSSGLSAPVRRWDRGQKSVTDVI